MTTPTHPIHQRHIKLARKLKARRFIVPDPWNEDYLTDELANAFPIPPAVPADDAMREATMKTTSAVNSAGRTIIVAQGPLADVFIADAGLRQKAQALVDAMTPNGPNPTYWKLVSDAMEALRVHLSATPEPTQRKQE